MSEDDFWGPEEEEDADDFEYWDEEDELWDDE